MIRYSQDLSGNELTLERLEELVDEHKASWRGRAQNKLDDFRILEKYEESSSIWSEIKAIFMRIQSYKCAYCERALEPEEIGKVEHDVEHFRPKGSVKKWNSDVDWEAQGVPITSVAGLSGGYYMLSYALLNYCMSCKPCNSSLKGDRFPIAGNYDLSSEDCTSLFTSERPYLIYPISDIDQDPEELIEFHALSPRPVSSDSHEKSRALVTIEFFKLDDPNKRSNLFKERAECIVLLYFMLTIEGNYDEMIASRVASSAKHANCSRSFKRLYENDPTEAEQVFELASGFMESYSPVDVS